jgi:conjugal transfer pilus assembly protein TraD
MAAQLQKAHKPKVMMIFDEFSVFAGDQVVNLINQGRSAGVHAVLATQSLADIQKKGGGALLGQILNNTNNYRLCRKFNAHAVVST